MKPYAPLGLLYLSSYLRGKGFDVEIYDSTFGSRDALFRMLETEPPATLGIYANLMTRANALAILERAVAVRLESRHGRSRTGQLCGSISGRRRARGGLRRRRTRAGSDPARRPAGTGARTVFSRCDGGTVNTGPARLLPTWTRNPGRTANASISTDT